MAPSNADNSHISSLTRNFLARLKYAAGPLAAPTAMTCSGVSSRTASLAIVSDVSSGSEVSLSLFIVLEAACRESV